MDSIERKERRYQRRKAARTEVAKSYGDKGFEDVFSFKQLYESAKKACKNARWKTSTINFETFLLSSIRKIYLNLVNGTRNFKSFQSFITIEHGKLRHIDALPIADRAMQKCLCLFLLTSMYSRSFILDNSASLKGKGMDFALERLKKQLRDHYRKYGLEGGIYQFDFKSYFQSIPHDKIKERLATKLTNEELYALMCDLIDDFRLLSTADPNSEYYKGVGLGSEISQIIALDYTSPIDHYVKDVCGIKGYGRYMDDGYVISNSIEELFDISDMLHQLAQSMGLKINDKKNIITPFKHHSFTFLKMRFTLTDTGHVIMKIGRRGVKSMRRKLKIFRDWVDEGKLQFADVATSYQSWRGHARRCHSYDILRGMDERFHTLFKEELRKEKKKFKCTMKGVKTKNGWVYFPRKKKGDEEYEIRRH